MSDDAILRDYLDALLADEMAAEQAGEEQQTNPGAEGPSPNADSAPDDHDSDDHDSDEHSPDHHNSDHIGADGRRRDPPAVDDLADRLLRAERCRELLDQVWGAAPSPEPTPDPKAPGKPSSPNPTSPNFPNPSLPPGSRFAGPLSPGPAQTSGGSSPSSDDSTLDPHAQLHMQAAAGDTSKLSVGDTPTVLMPSYECAEDEDFDLQNLGRFVIRRLLGRGGMGSVFLAHDPSIERDVALKIPHPGLLIHSGVKKRFLREARVAGRLQHPNLVSIHEAGEVGPICYIATSYCAGPTLGQWLASRKSPVPPELAARIVVELADALQHVHERGVLHRDLKPGNILLDPIDSESDRVLGDGFPYTPKIADFGLAELEGDASLTSMGSGPLGTAKYMSPEQASGESELIGPPTDIYALGVVLYELLCGFAPFEKKSLSATLTAVHRENPIPIRRYRDDVPRDLESICLKCLSKEPSQRYASAAELREDLRRLLQGFPTLAHPLGAAERLLRWSKRSPALAGLLAVSAMSVVGLIVGLTLYTQAARRHARQLEAAVIIAEDGQRRADAALAESRVAKKAADMQKAFAEIQQRRAETSELRARRMSYRSDIQRAYEYAEADRWSDVERLLARHLPTPDELDIRGLEWRALQARVASKLRLLGQHPGGVTESVMFPDGRRAASVGADGRVRIWDIANGKLLNTFRPGAGPLHSLAISPDGKTIAVGGKPQLLRLDKAYVYLLDAESGSRIRTLCRHDTTIESITFSPDGEWIASGSRYESIQLAQTKGDRIHRLPGARRNKMLAFSPDSRRLATPFQEPGNADGLRGYRIWEVETGKMLNECRVNQLHLVAWSPSGEEILAARTSDSYLLVLEPASGKKLGAYKTSNSNSRPLTRFAFSTDRKQLVAGDEAGMVHIWNWIALPSNRKGLPSDGKPRSVTSRRTLNVHADEVTSVTMNAVGVVLAGCDDGRLRRVMLENTSQLVEDYEWATALVASRRGDVYAADQEGVLYSREPRSRERKRIARISERPVVRLAVSETERPILAALDDRGRVYVVDAATGGLVWSPELSAVKSDDPLPDSHVAISADGRRIAVTRADDILHVLNVPEKKRLATLPKANIRGLAISPDGELVAYGGIFEEVYLLTVATGFSETAHRSGSRVDAARFSPDGRFLATANGDESVRLSDLHSGGTRILRGHQEPIDAVAFSSDSRTLVSADRSGGRSLRFWDTATGEEYGTLRFPAGNSDSELWVTREGVLMSKSGNDGYLLTRCEIGPEKPRAKTD